jgi:ABC-type nitrate/sulfonate/bicarbonate transport system ATPase subunit
VETIFLRDVAKEYVLPNGGRLKVLDRISCEITGGTFNSVLGPSGCGKSTLLGLIAGLDQPTSGEISVGARRPRVGFVFQQSRLLNWRTVANNVALPLEHMPLSKSERGERVQHYLQLVGLNGYENYYPLQLSGGMQQRASIARALAIDPDVLLMDEPFSGLDEWTARKMREELVRIWQETKKTVVFVTHSIAEAIFLSQQILIVTPKPATILRCVPVAFTYPREYDDLRLFELQTSLTKECLENWGHPGGVQGR